MYKGGKKKPTHLHNYVKEKKKERKKDGWDTHWSELLPGN